MHEIAILILFPLIASAFIFFIRKDKARNILVRICSIVTIFLTIYVASKYFNKALYLSFNNETIINQILMFIEILVAGYLIFMGIKNKKYIISIFSAVQTFLIIWFELTQSQGIEIKASMVFDKLSLIMVLVVGIIGSLVCLYTVGYMKWYHIHHENYKERKSFFFAVMFVFLAAMFGLVLSNELTWLYFCWELTTLCSFLLIGYTKTQDAIKNSFHALTINLGGGVCFALAIIFIGMKFKTLELSVLIGMKPEVVVLIPVFLLAISALTKSAQMPFSSWLLGAMVAPTPSSALLHSATMVKAGVYLLIRLAPLLGQSSVGQVVTFIGGITFLANSFIAISQSDAKKILAYSTIANLGLIVICASIGTQESLWAAILLIIFHAIAKSLLFLSVGSIEHQLGSRNVEDMDILLKVSRKLSLYIIIGIAGMFLAPFGMLISKWVAMKAFIDSNNILTVIILVYGSAATVFYWTKWMGKLVSNANKKEQVIHTFHIDEETAIFTQAVLVIISCFSFPIISKYALEPYLATLFGSSAVIPIGTSDVNIMLLMLSMFLILPISFFPIYKNDKRRKALTYMAGVNTGDNESFNSAFGKNREVEYSNWYMKDYFKSKKISFWSNTLCITGLCVGVILIVLAGGR
ncbi:MAG: proton-conducting transporter membrane subunit [Clostridia bacterium]